MGTPKNSIENKIENLVRSRKTKEARNLIRQYIYTHPNENDFTLKACDWYRRLGFYREGLQLVLPRAEIHRGLLNASPMDRSKMFWVAHFLNLLGANSYAFSILKELIPSNEFEHRVAGNIFFENFQFKMALPHYQEMTRLQKLGHKQDYSSRISQLGFADTLAGLKDISGAKKIAHEVLVNSP